MSGTIIAQGAGTISELTIGTLAGSVIAVEDTSAGSGTISGSTVGTVSTTGTISGGTINTTTVTGTMSGTIIAQGAGTISELTIGTLAGSVIAAEDTSAGAWTISGSTVGAVSTTGTITDGAINPTTVPGTTSRPNPPRAAP